MLGHRALEVGALHSILPPKDLRPFLIHAIERGMEKQLSSQRIVEKEAHEAAEEVPASSLLAGSQ